MMSVLHTFKLYEIVNKHFRNDEDSKAFVAEMDDFINVKLQSDNNDLATKADIGRLETEISKIEIKMGEGFKDILKWIITLMVGFASLIIAGMKMLS